MGLLECTRLLEKLSPPIDHTLGHQLITEFVSLERRYILRDWEPAELDGGQFCEILARIIYHLDSGNLNLTRDFGDCQSYVHNDHVTHALNRMDAKMVFAVISVVHKFRSKRGAVHISPEYKANHMDARYMIEAVRWAMVEIVRIFWTGDRDPAAVAIRELLRFDVPAVRRFEDIVLVQRTDLRPEEEVLILLHYAGDSGLTRRQLGQSAKLPPPSVTRALGSLESPDKRQIFQLPDGRYCLTDLGHKHIRENLADKLLLE